MAASSSASATERMQRDLEDNVGMLLKAFASASTQHHSLLLELWRDEHIAYLKRGFRRLSHTYAVLDASRPWLCYWILHSLAMLDEPLDPGTANRTVDFLTRCQDPNGGYGGGPGQMPHLATTYAAVNTLVTVGGAQALASIDRKKMLQFLLRMKQPAGGFSCQTYEGGIGGEPGAEAHGGYTFCGLAALTLLGQVDVLDLPNLVHWVVFRQGKVEGGFQGRTNKLVDGCYSFWQGGVFPMLQQLMSNLVSQQATWNTPIWAACDRSNIAQVEKHDEEIGLETPESTSRREADVREEGLDGTWSTSVQEKGDSSADSDGRESSRSTDWGVPEMLVKEGEGDVEHGRVKAEWLFPVIETRVDRAPITVTFEEIKEEEPGSAERERVKDGAGSSVKDQLGSDEQLLYGPLFNTQALQGYILLCCQVLNGGLRDKPGKSPDHYHTCYCLSGLSTSQYCAAHRIGAPPPPSAVLGPYSNLLEAVHPLCNVILSRYYEAVYYFKQLPPCEYRSEDPQV